MKVPWVWSLRVIMVLNIFGGLLLSYNQIWATREKTCLHFDAPFLNRCFGLFFLWSQKARLYCNHAGVWRFQVLATRSPQSSILKPAWLFCRVIGCAAALWTFFYRILFQQRKKKGCSSISHILGSWWWTFVNQLMEEEHWVRYFGPRSPTLFSQ